METKVILCDKCKKQVADGKCKICNADICLKCKSVFFIDITLKSKKSYPDKWRVGEIDMCKECGDKLSGIISSNDILIEKISEFIKNGIIVNELEK